MRPFIFARWQIVRAVREKTRRITSRFTVRIHVRKCSFVTKNCIMIMSRKSFPPLLSENRAICIATAMFQPRHVVRGNVPPFCIIIGKEIACIRYNATSFSFSFLFRNVEIMQAP